MQFTSSATYNPNIIRIFCHCYCLDGLQFHFDFEEDDDGSPFVYINALMDVSHYKAQSPWDCLKARVKAAWLVLTGKDRSLHDIILTKQEWLQFYGQLTEFTARMHKE